MKTIRLCMTSLFAALALAATSHAANLQDVVRDTQRTSVDDGKFSMVWWIPVQYWDESLKSTANVPDAVRAQITSIMGEYNVVALLRADAGAGGIENPQTKDELLKNTRVEMAGKVVEPLQTEQISPAALTLLSQLKPVLSATIGQMGQAMEFVVYPGKTDGKLLIDAAQSGSLAVTFYGKSHRWRLPLGSLLPPRTDKKTGEQFPGNYEYNPFTGGKLDK